jgi:hypothetical protein
MLHTVAGKYPENPTAQEKASCRQFFYSLRHLLPCDTCKNHYIGFIEEKSPSIESRQELVEWVLWLHNKVSNRMGDDAWTVDRLKLVYPDPDVAEEWEEDILQSYVQCSDEDGEDDGEDDEDCENDEVDERFNTKSAPFNPPPVVRQPYRVTPLARLHKAPIARNITAPPIVSPQRLVKSVVTRRQPTPKRNRSQRIRTLQRRIKARKQRDRMVQSSARSFGLAGSSRISRNNSITLPKAKPTSRPSQPPKKIQPTVQSHNTTAAKSHQQTLPSAQTPGKKSYARSAGSTLRRKKKKCGCGK